MGSACEVAVGEYMNSFLITPLENLTSLPTALRHAHLLWQKICGDSTPFMHDNWSIRVHLLQGQPQCEATDFVCLY